VIPVQDVLAAIGAVRVVPVIVIDDAAHARPLAQALTEGGLPCAEVTFRTPAAEAALRAMAREPDILVGAGTVLREEQVHRAVDAGARYIVTPGFSERVVRACQRVPVPVLPGVATATEVQMALEAGLDVVKFFPAGAAGGLSTLKALSAPFPMVRFVPTGGVSAGNLADYLAHPAVLAVGGSWMVPADLIAAGKFADITRLAAEAAAIAGRDRTGG
jgi:2-dehydro-3-deoxyphosphogluconate aldolase / (4S)-4-hydroxy-2-oxoglutarate aldolase